MTAAAEPRFRWGFIGPMADAGAEQQRSQPEPLLPLDVVEVSAGLGISDFTREGMEEAIGGRYWKCVDTLVGKKAQSVNLGGVPISSQLSRPRVLRLIEETQQKTGLPADFHQRGHHRGTEAAGLGVEQIAVASRWAPQLTQALTGYFAHGASRSRPSQARGNEPARPPR